MITLKNGLVFIDNQFKNTDILIDNQKIVKIDNNINEGTIIDCTNKLIAPAFIDPHVHMREPGYTHKETIKSGTNACLSGGYTQAFLMPNVKPVPNNIENVLNIINIIKKDSNIELLTTASITCDQSGKSNELSKMEEVSDYVVGFSDDGNGIQSSKLMYEAMLIAKKLNKPIISHCEDIDMVFNGVINNGEYSKKHNIKGILGISETLEVARNALLAYETKCHLHICHISRKETVDLIRYFKSLGVHITCEVSPHHLTLTDNDIKDNDANYKMNPPLAEQKDIDALINGLLDNTIDCIATDHAPHTEEEKSKGLEKSPFGIVGLETSFQVLYTDLVISKKISLELLLNKLSKNVSDIFNINSNEIKLNNFANIVIIDLNHKEKINKNNFKSLSKNTPYHEKECLSKICYTIYKGEVLYEA
ncbi:MAG: dihydroorotase [Anaeroplasmataceae bacterium]